jgi:N-acetylneuraminic acid mutarotase
LDKGYFGLGNDGARNKSDFWEYDPQNDNWTLKSTFPGIARIGAIAFSLSDKGYVGSGFNGNNKSDFYEYDPSSDTWTQKANTGGNARRFAVGFSIGNKGYLSSTRQKIKSYKFCQ